MNKNSANEYVSYYLGQYDTGNQEDAFHGLIESPLDIHEVLTDIFKTETDESKQSFIIDVISYFPDKRSYDILRTALASNKEKVWKSALDGLVSLSDSQAIYIIAEVCTEKNEPMFQEWAKEAIEQIQEKNHPALNKDNKDAQDETLTDNPKKPPKIDNETWVCFLICLSVPLSLLGNLINVPIFFLTPILFIAAVSRGIILLVKLFILKRDVKEKIINGSLVLFGLLIGPGLVVGGTIYFFTEFTMPA